MPPSKSVAPSSPDGWLEISDREIGNVSASLKGQASYDAVIDHALRAVEAALKALLWKQSDWTEWPKNTGETRYLWHHDLQRMLRETGLEDGLLADPELAASWQTIINANEQQHRYSSHNVADKVAWAVAKAARDMDKGVVPWLRAKYQQLT